MKNKLDDNHYIQCRLIDDLLAYAKAEYYASTDNERNYYNRRCKDIEKVLKYRNNEK